MTRTAWFKKKRNPVRPGVYLCRAYYTSSQNLQWWRLFDGRDWHAGEMATNSQGQTVKMSPSAFEQYQNPVIGNHVHFEWCGVIEGA